MTLILTTDVCFYHVIYSVVIAGLKHERVHQNLKIDVGVTRADTTVKMAISVPCHV